MAPVVAENMFFGCSFCGIKSEKVYHETNNRENHFEPRRARSAIRDGSLTMQLSRKDAILSKNNHKQNCFSRHFTASSTAKMPGMTFCSMLLSISQNARR
eukprot:2565144-Rhodomonas_salina.3